MNISLGRSSFHHAWKLFRCLPNCCFVDQMRRGGGRVLVQNSSPRFPEARHPNSNTNRGELFCTSTGGSTLMARSRSRSLSTSAFSSRTAPCLFRFELYPFATKSRFVCLAKGKYLNSPSSVVCSRFYASKPQRDHPHPASLKDSYKPSSSSALSTKKYLNSPSPVVCSRFYASKTQRDHPHSTASLKDSYKPSSSSALSTKIRKKVPVPRPDNESGMAEVVAYAISEEIDLEKLNEFLTDQKLYHKEPLPADVEDAIYTKAVYEVDRHCREVFFFREGVVVFWDMSLLERKEILQQVRKFCDAPYDLFLTMSENESLTFRYTDNPDTKINGYEIQLGGNETGTPDAHVLEKYAFSNSLGLSVKLSLWEESLARFIESIEPLSDDMRRGRKIRISRKNLLRKTGELFTLRHLVNLSSDLLDTPDFYWDRESLEPLYQKTINYLNVAKRTRVMNEKLKHCCELIELLSDHMNDKHHTRLEWMIIVLIMVEVMFEIIHYVEKYS